MQDVGGGQDQRVWNMIDVGMWARSGAIADVGSFRGNAEVDAIISEIPSDIKSRVFLIWQETFRKYIDRRKNYIEQMLHLR
jgi:hypothetical protein